MSYAEQLNASQKRAVLHSKGPLLIVAGAGTGKTTVIVEKISYLINKQHCQPNEILALTFTEKAATEMEERVDKALPLGQTADLWIATFHGFAERLLREHGLDIGLTTDFKLLDETAAWVLARNNLDKFNLDYYQPLGNPSKFIKALLKHFSKCKDEMLKPQDYLEYAETYRLDNDLRKNEEAALEARRLDEIANAYHVYQQLMLDNNYLDFGDLINYAYELFVKRPKILKKYQEQFKYVLLDEFQDTNYAQYQMVKMLASPRNNITVVGDDDQSIYKFRGASISNILEFKADYPKAEEIFLTLNYRSKQNILDLSYHFIQLNNPNRLEIKLKAEKKLSKELKASNKGKGEIEHLHLATGQDEVAAIVNKIIELYQQGNGKQDLKTNQGLTPKTRAAASSGWSDFAILVRANEQAKAFIEGLELAGIPYQYVASRGLYAKPVILNLVAFLKLLDNYHESDAMFRYLTLPVFNLPQAEIIKITHLAYKKSWTLFETAKQARFYLRLEIKAQAELERAVAFLEKYIARAKSEKTSRLVFDFLNESGYIKYIMTLPELAKKQEFSYLQQFYNKIKAFEELASNGSNGLAIEGKTTKDFLKHLGLELEAGEQGDLAPLVEEEGPEMVKVMTVHQAKGLEFKHVFLVNLVDQRFPTRERSEAIELPDRLVKEIVPEGDIHLQEERRLFYVGMTRAKEGLFFTSAESYGGIRKKKISVFLTDLGFKEKPAAAGQPASEKLETIKPLNLPASSMIQEFLPYKFSFTQIKDFQNCPRLYYFRYILKVPMRGNHYFSFGSTMHLTLQKYFEEVKKRRQAQQGSLFGVQAKKAPTGIKEAMSLQELLKIYEAVWIDDWYQNSAQKQKYFEQGKKLIKDFLASDYLSEAKPLYLEKMFSVKINGYNLTGKIDRVDQFENGLKIIDYKTGSPKEKLEAEDKEQLLIYQMAARALFHETVKELAYYYLENDSQVPFIGTEKEIAKLEEKIKAVIDEIKSFDFASFLKHHQSCDYCKEII